MDHQQLAKLYENSKTIFHHAVGWLTAQHAFRAGKLAEYLGTAEGILFTFVILDMSLLVYKWLKK